MNRLPGSTESGGDRSRIPVNGKLFVFNQRAVSRWGDNTGETENFTEEFRKFRGFLSTVSS